MGADSPPATGSSVEYAGFTFNGTGAEEAVKAIQADDRAKGKVVAEPEPKEAKSALSEAGSKLGKQGGKAAAEARAAKAETDKAQPANTEKEVEAEPEKKAATSEDDEEELAQHPRAKARVEEATRKAKEHREEAQRERESRIRLEARLEALERAPRTEREPARAEAEPETDEPQLDTYLTKHGQGGETKAISEWVNDRDKWRDGQQSQKAAMRSYVERIGKAETSLRESVKKAMAADESYWEKVQPLAAELRASHTLDPRGDGPTAINWLADELHLDPANAPAVMAHLASDPDDYRIIKSYRSPRDVTRAVAIIVARMGGATAGEPPSGERPASKPAQSMAPPPVRPVTGAPSIASGADPMPREGESFDSWNRRTVKKAAAR